MEVECGDGWHHLIDRLCVQIMNYLHSTFPRKLPPLEVVQVKEKFGGLRYYIEGYSDYKIDEFLQEAEELSRQTCEITGLSGCLHEKNGWLKTLCDKEANKRGFKKVNINKNMTLNSTDKI